MTDVFSSYEQGMNALLRSMGTDHPRRTEALTLQARLLENVAQARRYGDDESRRADRAQIIEGLNRLSMEALGVSFTDLCMGEVAAKPPPSLPVVPFVGLRPFRPEDAGLFFGRERCLQALISRLLSENWPLLVINGLSGVGKSSLVAAGLIPRLRERGYAVAWANILDSPQSDVLRGIRREFSATEHADSILEAVDQACPSKRPFVLVVDQLERCFTLGREGKERLEFWREMAHLLRGEARCPVKVVFVVRSDWLHAFQTVTPTPLDLPVFSFLALIDPLSMSEAREALLGPLGYLQIAYEPELIDTVVADLASSDGHVDPPQLQIVGEALYHRMRERLDISQGTAKLSLQDYHLLHGARAIIRGHLINAIENLGPEAQMGWQILHRLVGPENQRLSKRAEDLRGNLSDQAFNRLAEYLGVARLLVREYSSADGVPVYTLTHDYLIDELNHHFAEDRDLQAWKTAERYLDTGLADWRDARRTTGQEVVLERDRYLHIWSQQEALGELSEEANDLLLRSGLNHGEESFSYWLTRLPGTHSESALETSVMYCLYADKTRRETAQKAVKRAIRENLLTDDHRLRLKELLWREFALSKETKRPQGTQSTEAERRESAAVLLWALRRSAAFPERLRVAPVATRVWLAEHRVQAVTALGSALLVAVIVLAFWAVRESQRGRWYPVQTLFAGPISAAAVSPSEPDTLYVVTPKGATTGEGATLLWRRGTDRWQVLSRSITYNPVSTLLVTSSNGKTRLYMSIRGKGILRSDDNGTSWELINAGLHSYAVEALVTDPNAPDVLFAGSSDRKGVFESQDGGERWQDVSGDELFGASVISMAYTPYDGGAFLAGTDDGRIVARKGNEPTWQMVSAYPAIGSIVCMSAEPKAGQYIYAGTSTGNVLVSADGGADWILLGKPSGVFEVRSIVAKPGEPNVVYMDAFGVGGYILWKSENNGQTWHHVSDDQFTREGLKWLLIPGERAGVLYTAGAAGLFETADGGSSWAWHQDLGVPLAGVKDIAVGVGNEGPTYAAVGGSVYASSDPEVGRWVRGSGLLAIEVRDVVVDLRDPAVAYAGVYLPGEWSVFITRDGGRTWQQTIPPRGIAEWYLNDTMALEVGATAEGGVLYAGTNGCGVVHSTDQGVTWEAWGRQDCSLPLSAPKNILDLAIDPSSPDKLYAAADSAKVYVTTDRGRTWESYPISLSTEINAIETDPEIEGRVYLIAGSSGFWRSDDGAETWRKLSRGLEEKPLSALAVVEGLAEEVFVAAASGEVWKTTDGGEHWTLQRENLAVSSILTIASVGEQIWLGGNDGIYRYEPGSLPGIRKEHR